MRKLRFQYKGAMYHLISRGNKNESIFPTDKTKTYFLELLGQGAEEYEIDCYAYCVMDTHYHLQVQINEVNLPDFMHYLGSSYANYLVRNDWFGHVFAGRYKSILVDKEEYMLTVNRYIHLNPLSAGLVEHPEDYAWSSFPAYFHGGRRIGQLKTDWLQEYFGQEPGAAYKGYYEFTTSGMKNPSYYPHENLVGQVILGDEGFVRRIVSSVEEDERQGLLDLLEGKATRYRHTLEEVYGGVCEHVGLGDLSLGNFRGDRIYRDACNLLIYVARKYTRSSNRDIAEVIGNINPNAVSQRYAKVKHKLEEDPLFRGQFDEDVKRALELASNTAEISDTSQA